MLDLLKALAEAIVASITWVSVTPIGLPPLLIPTTNGQTITVQASANLTDWSSVSPSFESEIYTNGFATNLVPSVWHYETNVVPTTNIFIGWNNNGYWETNINDQPVTNWVLHVDSWQTNLEPRLAWKRKQAATNQAPTLFLRLKSL